MKIDSVKLLTLCFVLFITYLIWKAMVGIFLGGAL